MPSLRGSVLTRPSENLEAAHRYLTAIESGATGADLALFFTSDAVHEEFPNRLAPYGKLRQLDDILEDAVRGKRLVKNQRFEILHAVESHGHVALEIRWTGTLAIPGAGISRDGFMYGRFAVFLEYRDGRIARQRSYDCFEPW